MTPPKSAVNARHTASGPPGAGSGAPSPESGTAPGPESGTAPGSLRDVLVLDRPITLPTTRDTRALGAAVAELLRPGDLVVLAGPLGAGKTTFAQGVGDGLGVTGPVVSPTFVIARVYEGGRVPMVHVDAYRLNGVDEVEDLDLDVESTVTMVEWGEGMVEPLVDGHLVVRLDRAPAQDVRTAVIEAHGPGWRERFPARAGSCGP